MKKPLLSTLWWVSVVPFGLPVVPEVNWMLIGSSNCSVSARSARRVRWAGPPSPATASNAIVPGLTPPIWMTLRRLGTRAACNRPGCDSASSGSMSRSIAM